MEYNKLVAKIKQSDVEYFEKNKPSLSNQEYDALVEELQAFEANNPSLVSPDSPSQKLHNDNPSADNTIMYNPPMLSLNKVYNDDKLNKFLYEFANFDTFVIEPKCDGVAICLQYHNNKLASISTRGDGKIGNIVDYSNNIYKEFPSDIPLGTFEVRGELVMVPKKDDTDRNQIAAYLRTPKIDYDITQFVAYDYIPHGEAPRPEQETESLALLAQYFTIPNYFVCTREDVINNVLMQKEINNKLPYNCDGVVIKANSKAKQKEMGHNHTAPFYSVAYKWNLKKGTSRLLNVSWQQSRNGVFSPIANIEPVDITGTTISKITLNNLNYIKELNVKIGDIITVVKNGDIIPAIGSVHFAERTGEESDIEPISICPYCNQPLTNKLNPTCINTECPNVIIKKIEHFAKVMGIKGLGTKTIEKLNATYHFKRQIDIYQVLDNVQIQNSKHKNPLLFVEALGLEGLGATTCKQLTKQQLNNKLKENGYLADFETYVNF